MKAIRWTSHALAGLQARDIDRLDAEQAIHEPTAVQPGYGGRTLYLRRYHDSLLEQEMLLCVVTEAANSEIVIVTLYKTSKLAKYLQGENQ